MPEYPDMLLDTFFEEVINLKRSIALSKSETKRLWLLFLKKGGFYPSPIEDDMQYHKSNHEYTIIFMNHKNEMEIYYSDMKKNDENSNCLYDKYKK